MKAFLEKFYYGASWGGLLRITFWTAFFIWLAGHYAPPPPKPSLVYLGVAATKQVRLVATIPEDPRYVSFPPKQEGTNIYWVQDSTVAVHHPDPDEPRVDLDTVLVPTYVLDILHSFAGRKDIGFDVNAQPYLGGVEFYSAAAAAIAAKPDMIVISVSPFNLFTSHEIIQRPAHLSRASSLWAKHPQSWGWMLFLPSPANHLWALAGQWLPLVRDASLYKGFIDRLAYRLPKQVWPQRVKQSRDIGGVGRRIVFWFCEGNLKEECPSFFTPEGKTRDMLIWYREKLRAADIAGTGITRSAWEKSLEILRDSGIPTLIYNIPVGNFISAPETYANLPKIEAILKESAEKYKGTNVQIIPAIPDEIVKTVRFRYGDSEHLAQEGHFPRFLAEQIWAVMKEKNIGGKHAH